MPQNPDVVIYTRGPYNPSDVLISQTAPTGGGTNYVRSVSETVGTATDTPTRALALARSIAETGSTADTPSKTLILARTTTETASPSDAVNRALIQARNPVETATTIDVVNGATIPITPAVPVTYGGTPQPAGTRRLRTILRYRLHITGWGALQDQPPEAIIIRATATTVPIQVGARTEHPCRITIDSTAQLRARSETAWTISRTDTVHIDDPDEWIVLDDLTLT